MNGVFCLTRRSDGAAVTGDAASCMARLGLSRAEFRRLLRGSRSGAGEWRVRHVETDWREAAAREWDRQFSWYPPYPCEGCVFRSLCEHEDWYCRSFALWFRRGWDCKAGALRQHWGKSERRERR